MKCRFVLGFVSAICLIGLPVMAIAQNAPPTTQPMGGAGVPYQPGYAPPGAFGGAGSMGGVAPAGGAGVPSHPGYAPPGAFGGATSMGGMAPAGGAVVPPAPGPYSAQPGGSYGGFNPPYPGGSFGGGAVGSPPVFPGGAPGGETAPPMSGIYAQGTQPARPTVPMEVWEIEVLRQYIDLVERYTRLAEDPAAAGVAAVVTANEMLRARGPEAAIAFFARKLDVTRNPAVQRAIRLQLIDLYKATHQEDKALEQIEALILLAPAGHPDARVAP